MAYGSDERSPLLQNGNTNRQDGGYQEVDTVVADPVKIAWLIRTSDRRLLEGG